MPDNNFKELQQETQTKIAVVEVIKSEVIDIKLKSIADVQARLKAYKLIRDNYEAFLTDQAELLAKPEDRPDWTTFKELGILRLIAAYLTETERWLDMQEPVLDGAERAIRKVVIPYPAGDNIILLLAVLELLVAKSNKSS